MKKAYIYLTFIVMAVLGTASCSKHSSLDMPEEKEAQENKIGFGSVSAQRAGEVTPDASKKRQIQVYDYYTAEGTSTPVEYIDELIQESATAGVWAYVKEGKTHSYSWKKGTHKFFGWEAVDSTGAAARVLNYNSEDKVLTIAGENNAPVALPGTANTDYRYAQVNTVAWPKEDMYEKDADGKTTGVKPVSLTVKHLSAALSYTVENFTGQTYTIESISVSNVVTTAAPTVNFSGTEAAIAYNLGTDKGSVSLVLGEGDNAKKTCVWPQTVEGSKLTVNYKLGTTDKEVTIGIPKTTWKAGKYYNFKLQIRPSDVQLIFEVMPWTVVDVPVNTESGSINMSNVTWQNTVVTLNQGTATESTANTLDNGAYSVYMYHNASVQVIKLDANGQPIHQTYPEDVKGEDGETIIHHAGDNVVDEYGNPTVYEMEWKTYDYYPAQGYFTVNYPKSGLFKIELIPAYGQTEEDLNASMYEIYIYEYPTKKEVEGQEVTVPGYFRPINPEGETISMKTVYFQVRASENVAAPHPQYKAQIDIWFKATDSNEWVSGYSEIRATYACIIPAVN